jgi:hypothetical protein
MSDSESSNESSNKNDENINNLINQTSNLLISDKKEEPKKKKAPTCSNCGQEGHTNSKKKPCTIEPKKNTFIIPKEKIDLGLYGLNTINCCGKDQSSEKVSNALLPISYGIYAEDKSYSIPLCKANLKIYNMEKCFNEGIKFDTEKKHIHPNFINPPPNDVCTTLDDNSFYYESKVVSYKGDKTELILRQDCYAFNCIQNILINNPSKKYNDTDSLLNDSTIIEHPYLWMLIWKKINNIIFFDCVIFTNVSVIRMIKNADTSRSKESLKLIEHSLSEYSTKGIMTYKESKSKTVAHQKLSLFPLRDIDTLKEYNFMFNIKSTDLVLKDVRPDTSLWQVIEKSKLIDKIRKLEEEINCLKPKII